MAEAKRVVILGAGFGGVYAVRGLQRLFPAGELSLTVVNRENYFLFTPLLHEVATGSLAPHTIVEPLRTVLRAKDSAARIVLGEARRVRLDERAVELADGSMLSYDTLVVALGSQTNFFGVTGAAEYALDLKTMGDAIRLKRRCIDAFEAAAVESDPARRAVLLRVAVVGGGPTGVELAAELAEFAFGSLLPMYASALGDVRPQVLLLQAGNELLPQFSVETRGKALAALRRKGIDVRLNTSVTAVAADGVTLADGSRLEASTTVWVAGIRPFALDFDAPVERDRAGRIIVDERLRLKGRDNVYVIGDIACATPAGRTAPLPPFAQVASRQASYVARAIADVAAVRVPPPFAYRHLGNLVSLGQWAAAAEIGPFKFWGHFAWWMWRTIYLTKFISVRKKFSIALQWTINLVSPRDVTRITISERDERK